MQDQSISTIESIKKTEKIAQLLTKHQVKLVYLKGSMGAGKTAFVQLFLENLGNKSPVVSPTYNLVNVYEVKGKNIAHFDLYRLDSAIELENIGIRDFFSEKYDFVFIEWADKFSEFLPISDLILEFYYKNKTRLLKSKSFTSAGQKFIKDLNEQF